MKKPYRILEARAVRKEVLSPGKFVNLPATDRSKIKQTKIVAPSLGGKGFGGLLVEYKTPIYKVG